MKKVLRLFTDGASRGNPGPAGAGVVIEDEGGMKLKTMHRWLGQKTNNEAEYLALIDGIREAGSWKPDRLEIVLDSDLVVKQIKREYRVKNAVLRQLFDVASTMLAQFPEWNIKHVDREQNKRADFLANMAIDEHVKPKR